MLQNMFGGNAREREIEDEIDLQLIASAAAKYTGSGDEAEGDKTIDNPNISEGELEVALLRIRSELRAPAVTRSRTASLAREQREHERATDTADVTGMA
jgi:hypothetical protein